MIKQTLAAVALIAASSTVTAGEPVEYYAVIGTGLNTALTSSGEWKGSDTAAAKLGVMATKKVNDRVTVYAEYTHYSQWAYGKPFNDKAENSLDHFGIGIHYKLN